MKKTAKIKRFIFDGIMGAYLLMVLWVTVLDWGLGTATPLNIFDGKMLLLDRATSYFFLGFVLSLLVSHYFNSKGYKTLGELIFEPAYKKVQNQEKGSKLQSFWFWQMMVFLMVTLIKSIQVTQVSIVSLFDYDGFQGVLRLLSGLATPNMELLPKAVSSVIVTVFMAFIATALAIPIAFVLSFLSAKNIMKTPLSFVVYTCLRTFFNVIRSIEALIWALIFSVWVGIGPFAGMLALMIHSVASLAKQYSEIIETVQEGPIEGILSTGATKLQMVWFAIVPQVILPFVSFTIYRWDINIRMATIIGLVGGGGIGTLFMQYSGQAMWNEVGTIILVIAFVVWFMDTASAYLREALK
jgi:phosphonate transport system permease protein